MASHRQLGPEHVIRTWAVRDGGGLGDALIATGRHSALTMMAYRAGDIDGAPCGRRFF